MGSYSCSSFLLFNYYFFRVSRCLRLDFSVCFVPCVWWSYSTRGLGSRLFCGPLSSRFRWVSLTLHLTWHQSFNIWKMSYNLTSKKTGDESSSIKGFFLGIENVVWRSRVFAWHIGHAALCHLFHKLASFPVWAGSTVGCEALRVYEIFSAFLFNSLHFS